MRTPQCTQCGGTELNSQRRCAECHRARSRRQKVEGPARDKKNEQRRANRLRVKYGISPEEYDALLAKQKGVCGICFRPPKKIRLAVDHDHKGSGRESVRGLLCGMCNRRILGVIERYKVTPQAIVDYLQGPRPFAENREREHIVTFEQVRRGE